MANIGFLEWPIHTVVLDDKVSPALERLIEKEYRAALRAQGIDLEDDNNTWSWSVGEPLFRTRRAALFLEDVRPTSTYSVFEKDELLLESANLDLEDNEQTLGFVGRFGFPNPTRQVLLECSGSDGSYASRPLHDNALYAFESLQDVRTDISGIQHLLDRFFEVKSPTPFLAQIEPPSRFNGLSREERFTEEIKASLGERVAGLRLDLFYRGGKIEGGLVARTLLDVLYFQVLEVVTGVRKLGRCADPECRKYFSPKRLEQKYCDKECSRRAIARTAYRKQALDRLLVRFVGQADGSWKEKLLAWNGKYPDIGYEKEADFKAAYRAALKKGKQNNS